MAVIKSDSPDSPPPAYAHIPSISSEPSNASHDTRSSGGAPQGHPNSHQSHLQAGPPPGPAQHAPYGPTPLTAQQQSTLLPYYDPRSPYYDPRTPQAIQQATSRARWRFFHGFLWAVGIYFAIGVVTGGIVVDIRRAG